MSPKLGKLLGVTQKLPLEWSIALRQIEGIISTNKYSVSPSINTADESTDIWTIKNNLVYLTEACCLYFTSSNDEDDQEILVIGMKANWELDFETITLNGNTPVETVNEYIRIVRVKNNNGIQIVGEVYCCSTVDNLVDGVPTVLDDIQAHVLPAYQQTLMSHMSTPAKYYTLLLNSSLSLLNIGNTQATSADIDFHVIEFGKTDIVKIPSALNSGGSSFEDKLFQIPYLIPPKSDIRFDVNKVARNATKINSFYTIVFIHESKLSSLGSDIPA